MKTANLVGLGALALAAYLLYRKTMDPKSKKAEDKGEKAPEANAAGYSYAIGDMLRSKKRVTVDDLSYKPGLDSRLSLRVRYRRRRPETKQPIYINPTNQIPNVYGRGVGASVVGMNQLVREAYMNADGTQMYASFGGRCSEDLQKACSCVTGKTDKYKLDIPQLP